MELPKILPQPERPSNLSEKAQWLAGEGAGSWFMIEANLNQYEVTRYSPKGIEECKGKFTTNEPFNPDAMFSVTYPSHCLLVSVLQDGIKITLKKAKQN